MKNNTRIHKITAILLAAISIGVGSLLFYGPSTLAQDVTATGAQVGGDILSILSDLKQIRLDDSIFSDPEFQSLKDYSVNIPPEVVGRKNPFLPIGAGLPVSSANNIVINTSTTTP